MTSTTRIQSVDSIDVLDLSTRLSNMLRRAGIFTIADLTDRTPADLRDIRNFGPLALTEIKHKLNQHGQTLATSEAST